MSSLPLRQHCFTGPAGRLAALYCAPAKGAERGVTVVVVSGLYGSKEDSHALLPHLADAGYRVFAYDHRGQHESDGTDDPADYTLEALTQDLLAVLTQINPSEGVHLVGLCMGGFVARAAVQSAAPVRSLAVVGWHLNGDRAVARRLRAAAAVGQRIGCARTVAMASGWAERYWPHDRVDPAFRQITQARLATTRPAHYLGLTRALASALQAEHPGNVPVPALMVSGSEDNLFPASGFTDAARRLGIPHAVIPGTGHLAQLHQPQAVARVLLRFWDTAAPLAVPRPGHRNPSPGVRR
ncbi:alpha/beta fold hydrolase [Streptomyces gobitricini]|uniref:AB hydrolase-1 domain-containing protein n=1 Tax=Streptomyces gobitricini TaxID=68211 RepID=A0ABP5ZHI1_9ACTN